MAKAVDTGTYWQEKEYETVSHALCLIDLFDEFIEASADGREGLWFLYDCKANLRKIVDAYEPEGEPEGGFKDNVVSFLSYRATKR